MSKLNSPPPGTCALAGLFVSIVCAMVFGYGLALVAHKPDFKPYALVIQDDCYIDDDQIIPAADVLPLIETPQEQN